MSQKKKGFALIEVLVVILVSVLVLTMVGGSMVFIATTTGELIQQAEEIQMARNIEKHLRTLYTQEGNLNYLNLNNGNIVYEDEIIFSDSCLNDFEIKTENDFIKCYMRFQSGKQFEFIIGIENKNNGGKE